VSPHPRRPPGTQRRSYGELPGAAGKRRGRWRVYDLDVSGSAGPQLSGQFDSIIRRTSFEQLSSG